MGYESWIKSFIQEHENESIARVIEDILNKENLPIEIISTFVDYCNYYFWKEIRNGKRSFIWRKWKC